MNKEVLPKRDRRLFLIIAITAFVGLADTIYLTVSHFQGSGVICSIVDGCNLVLGSSWATILGVPMALIGSFYYLAVLFLLGFVYFRRSQLAFSGILAITTVGFIMSLGFLYLQIFVIEALCEYCLLSLAATTIIWIATLAQTHTQR